MPLYEFVCSGCKKKTEELCSGPVESIGCPRCGAEAKKIFSTFRTGKNSSGGSVAASGGCGG